MGEGGDAFAQQPWPHDGERTGRMKLHCCGNEMGGVENESGRGLHGWSFFLFESESALEVDSMKQNVHRKYKQTIKI